MTWGRRAVMPTWLEPPGSFTVVMTAGHASRCNRQPQPDHDEKGWRELAKR